MYESAKIMGLSKSDTMRWLWSYYSSRFPGGRSRANKRIGLTISDVAGTPLHLTMRTNGWDWTIANEIFALNGYRFELDNVKRVLDLGGNMGLAALYFERVYPAARIVTVEPIPDNLAILRRNLESNHSKVEVIPAAAGPRDEKVQFQISEDPGGHSSQGDKMKMLPTGDYIQVDALSVPSLMERIGWSEIDLLKIDIEGSEAEILNGGPAWLSKVRCIIGEGHAGVGYTIDVCRQDLEPMGFEVHQLEQKEFAMLFIARRRGAAAQSPIRPQV